MSLHNANYDSVLRCVDYIYYKMYQNRANARIIRQAALPMLSAWHLPGIICRRCLQGQTRGLNREGFCQSSFPLQVCARSMAQRRALPLSHIRALHLGNSLSHLWCAWRILYMTWGSRAGSQGGWIYPSVPHLLGRLWSYPVARAPWWRHARQRARRYVGVMEAEAGGRRCGARVRMGGPRGLRGLGRAGRGELPGVLDRHRHEGGFRGLLSTVPEPQTKGKEQDGGATDGDSGDLASAEHNFAPR